LGGGGAGVYWEGVRGERRNWIAGGLNAAGMQRWLGVACATPIAELSGPPQHERVRVYFCGDGLGLSWVTWKSLTRGVAALPRETMMPSASFLEEARQKKRPFLRTFQVWPLAAMVYSGI